MKENLSHGILFVESFLDVPVFFSTNPLNRKELFRTIFNYVKSLFLKFIYNPLCHFLSNMGNHCRRKVRYNGSFTFGHDFFKVCEGKLFSVLVVVGEVSSKFVF